MVSDDEDRIREEAYKLWLAEGCPHGRAERHWAEAKEIVALRDSNATTLEPVENTTDVPAEPALAFENQADVPELTDNSDDQSGPSWGAAKDIADADPLSVERAAPRMKGGAARRDGARR